MSILCYALLILRASSIALTNNIVRCRGGARGGHTRRFGGFLPQASRLARLRCPPRDPPFFCKGRGGPQTLDVRPFCQGGRSRVTCLLCPNLNPSARAAQAAKDTVKNIFDRMGLLWTKPPAHEGGRTLWSSRRLQLEATVEPSSLMISQMSHPCGRGLEVSIQSYPA